MPPLLYPAAKWQPLLGHSISETLEQRNLIVLHITDGSTADGAIQTFKASVAPHRISAHFVIDRDGTIIQLLDLRDTAWHASQVNRHSVGIEHVAMSKPTANRLNMLHPDRAHYKPLPATDAQYVASAYLLAWLCKQMKLPISRNSIRSHWEASPIDNHPLCCTGGLDPDRVVKMAQQFGAAPA